MANPQKTQQFGQFKAYAGKEKLNIVDDDGTTVEDGCDWVTEANTGYGDYIGPPRNAQRRFVGDTGTVFVLNFKAGVILGIIGTLVAEIALIVVLAIAAI